MEKKKRKICNNCKFAGDKFRIEGLTHVHCENKKEYPDKDLKSGKISPWETLREFWNTCNKHELK